MSSKDPKKPKCEPLSALVRVTESDWLRLSNVYFPHAEVDDASMYSVVPHQLLSDLDRNDADADTPLPTVSRLITSTLVCGDFNTHHPDISNHLGKAEKATTSGTNLVNWCRKTGHSIANDKTLITRRGLSNTAQSNTAPDVTVHRGCEVKDWTTITEDLAICGVTSDHDPIIFDVVVGDDTADVFADATFTHSTRPLFAFRRANWRMYRMLLQKSTNAVARKEAKWNKRTPNQKYEWLANCIRIAQYRSIPY
mgnify:CR=1 FL=1